MMRSSGGRRARRLPIVALSWLVIAASPEAGGEEATRALDRLLELNAAAKLQSAEARALLTGEALSHWSTDSIGPIHGSPDRIVSIGVGSLVARVTVRAPNGEAKDFYFYLERDDGWRVAAMRTLSTVEPLYVIRDMEVAERSKLAGGSYMADNARLALLSDSEPRAWFSNHSEALQRLVGLIEESAAELHRVDAAEPGAGAVVEELRELALSSARRLPNGAEIIVGGIIDNSVGFLYLSSGSPPPISPDEYIWVESLGSGWFLFRTT